MAQQSLLLPRAGLTLPTFQNITKPVNTMEQSVGQGIEKITNTVLGIDEPHLWDMDTLVIILLIIGSLCYTKTILITCSVYILIWNKPIQILGGLCPRTIITILFIKFMGYITNFLKK